MKVLQVCSKVPFPAKDGGCLAMLNMAEMLHLKNFEVKILAMETLKHPYPEEGFPKQFIQNYQPETVFVDTSVSPIKALLNLIFSKRSFHLVRFENKNFEEKLLRILKEFDPDFVLLDSLFSCGYIKTIRSSSKAKIVYRAHNIEHIIWQEIALKTKSFFKKIYLKIQSKRLKQEELALINNCEAIIAITQKDNHFFKLFFPGKKCITIPFTINLSAYEAYHNFNEKSLFFIGAMDWYPNLEGIRWFIDKVWDKVLLKHPTAILNIAGKAMPEELKNLEKKQVFNFGEVEHAKSFMEKYPIMIAPIFSGGGLKIKIVEAMAMGKIIICNPQAATGIDAKDKESILLANSADDFIEIINHCFANMGTQKKIGEQARIVIQQQFDLSTKANELSHFMKTIQ